jgi:hypothetical protein
MPDFAPAFAALRAVLAKHSPPLIVKTDNENLYTLVTTKPSPLPQHKGHPMWFGEVRLGKAYVSIHLMPIYMNDELTGSISPELKKRMQGKTCFNFKTAPDPELLEELSKLASAGLKSWSRKNWA